jgi:biotin carboxyl carrier protein
MKYWVTVEGREREVEVQLSPDGRISGVTLDGAPVDVDAVAVPGGVSLRLGARVFDVAIGGKPDALTVAAGAQRAVVAVQSERARAVAAKRGNGLAGAGSREVRSPMPGRVVKVLVAVGDVVEAQQPVVVVEAMKMENELRALAAGTVESVHVKPGDAVDGSTLLVRLAHPA